MQQSLSPEAKAVLGGMTKSESVDVLETELDRLRNSCQHLQRSNDELQEALDLEGPDADFTLAVEVLAGTAAAVL